MFFVTLKQTLRPGRINGYRVSGGIAGYLLIGLTWTFAYQLLVQRTPAAIHFGPDVEKGLPRLPSHLIYFSFTTLTTVGFGDVHPVTAAAQALTVAEALVGQLYIAILISALVGMALQTRPVANGRAPRMKFGLDRSIGKLRSRRTRQIRAHQRLRAGARRRDEVDNAAPPSECGPGREAPIH
jgi:hypothetical protein